VIDEETYKRFLDAQERAKQSGLALIEALDYRRLLLTKQREHDIKVALLEDLYRRLDLQSPNKLLSFYIGRPDGSAAEMFEAVKQWLDTVTSYLAEDKLEDL